MAAVAGMAPKTMQPELVVVASSVETDEVPTAVYLTSTVTSATPAVGAGALPTSTSRADPVGGVTTPVSTTGAAFAMARAQLTVDVIRSALLIWFLCCVTLQPSVPSPPTKRASCLIVKLTLSNSLV